MGFLPCCSYFFDLMQSSSELFISPQHSKTILVRICPKSQTLVADVNVPGVRLVLDDLDRCVNLIAEFADGHNSETL
jgi:hypothetical protein